MNPSEDFVPVPRLARFPIELNPPPGFHPEDPATWPETVGRLEYVGGELLFMPPCGDVQQDVAMSVAGILWSWRREHQEFLVGGNEAGMLLGSDVRAADAAVWRRADLGQHTGGYRRTPPLLAVEVAGQNEEEPALREKARWYLDHGVSIVWIVLPSTRETVVVQPGALARFGEKDRLPEHPALPGLAPAVADIFEQL